jgi:hypothetical protein
MLQLDIRPDLAGLTRQLNHFQRTQVPFASALTLTSLAKKAAAAETAELGKVFDAPTPFTGKAFAVIPAKKSSLTATLFVKDIQAAYLAPYIQKSGAQVLGRKAGVLKPVDQPVNMYGNLPRGKLASLKGRPDIFVGQVKTKDGAVDGVWQRVTVTRKGRTRTRGKGRRGRIYSPEQGRLRLLIRFADPVEVGSKHPFPYEATAAKTIRANLKPDWEASFARALRTAR